MIQNLLCIDAQFFQEHFARLFRSVSSYIRRQFPQLHPEDVEDITMSSIARAFKARATFRGDCQFETWLQRIAFNEGCSYLRTTTRQATVNLYYLRDEDTGQEDPIESRPHLCPELFRAVEVADICDRILNVSHRLSEPHRISFLMYTFENMSCRDISQKLGINLQTIKTHIRRARLQIMQRLDPQDLISIGIMPPP